MLVMSGSGEQSVYTYPQRDQRAYIQPSRLPAIHQGRNGAERIVKKLLDGDTSTGALSRLCQHDCTICLCLCGHPNQKMGRMGETGHTLDFVWRLCFRCRYHDGGKWAYESLSFGGYWAWDPVENASLVPWLILVAGLHTMVIYQATGHS